MRRYLICALGVALAVPLLGLIVMAWIAPLSLSGIVYLLGGSLIVAGLLIAPWQHKYPFLVGSGVIVIVGMACLRVILVRTEQATSNLKMIVLPQGKETSWLNDLLDEQDSVVLGEAVLHLLGGVTPREHENIASALATAYSELRVTQSVFPSPVAGTYLNFQRAAAFDTLVIEPINAPSAKIGIVFLHGFMGNVTIQCWRIAQAVQNLGAVTICPSTDWIGDWWKPQGEAIVRASLSYLRGRGIERIYLGGFSNGGFGLSRLAPQLTTESGLRGLFFIDGVSHGPEVRETNSPVLVIQGTYDERMPVTEARQVVEALGELGTYAEVESDHFLIMKQPVLVQHALATWLEEHESDQ